MAARQRLGHIQPLIKIDHQGDFRANRVTQRRGGGEVIGQPVPSHAELQGREIALGDQFQRFGRDRRRRFQP